MTAEEIKTRLLEKYKKGFKKEQYNNIVRAMEFAENAHKDQKRKSGEPYILHPYLVSEILFDLGFDSSTLMAALLHDVVEDTPYTSEDIKDNFGETVSKLVDGVTKLAMIKFDSEEKEQAENFRKMFIAMSEDIRVIAIKLADRLHNMRTLDVLSPERRIAISKETLEIYAPLAGRLGVSKVKTELEDLAMKYVYPKEYAELDKQLPIQQKERLKTINSVMDEIKAKLAEYSIEANVYGRVKHYFSIFKKMRAQGKKLDEIYDIIAVRIIVKDIKDCYASLGVVHTMYKFLPDRFKDYISMPKINNYQSLHTTVMTTFGFPVEIQIRTEEMHRIAEYGIAAHWKYKEGVDDKGNLQEKVKWIREVLEAQTNSTEEETLVDNVKIDVFKDEIFVFTPKGKSINLPVGATVVDFAYRIHSRIGDQCVGAFVNSKHVALNTVLKMGDIVEIITNSTTGPSRDWLNFVVSPQTKSKIRQYFKKNMREDNIRIGKEMLEKEAVKFGVSLTSDEAKDFFDSYLERKGLNNMEDIYAQLGFGELTTKQIFPKIVALLKKKEETENGLGEIKPTSRTRKSAGNVTIMGYEGLLIKIAGCCNPVPGDDIRAYLSRGRGAIIHKTDCPNLSAFEPERLLKATWSTSVSEEFVARVSIFVDNRKGIVADITSMLSLNKINIDSLSAKILKTGDGVIDLAIELTDRETLDLVVKKLMQIKGVYNVQRK